MRAAFVVVIALIAGVVMPATADAQRKRKKKAESELEDVAAVRSRFILLTDGEGGYLAVDPGWPSAGTGTDEHWLFYGDGKTFWRQRVFSAGADGTQGTWSRRFWSPRVASQADVDAIKRNGADAFVLRCGKEEVELKKVPAAEAIRIVDRAVFQKPRWRRQAHSLARDDRGNYYYVDRLRDELGGKGHRIFVGQKGALRELPMINIVSDSVGEIYATKKGELRFVTSTSSATWVQGNTKLELTIVPVEDNVAMIYGDLGVYEGTLGTPCDEF